MGQFLIKIALMAGDCSHEIGGQVMANMATKLTKTIPLPLPSIERLCAESWCFVSALGWGALSLLIVTFEFKTLKILQYTYEAIHRVSPIQCLGSIITDISERNFISWDSWDSIKRQFIGLWMPNILMDWVTKLVWIKLTHDFIHYNLNNNNLSLR